MLRTAVNE